MNKQKALGQTASWKDDVFIPADRESLRKSIYEEGLFIINMRELAEKSIAYDPSHAIGHFETTARHVKKKLELICILREKNEMEIEERRGKSDGFIGIWHRTVANSREKENLKLEEEAGEMNKLLKEIRSEIGALKPVQDGRVSQEFCASQSRRASSSQASP